jgi:hypothetical protein
MPIFVVKQAFFAAGTDLQEGLLETTQPSLTGWYADPIAASAAQTLLVAAQRQLQSRLRHAEQRFPLHLLRMICHYWTRSDSLLEYQQLSALAGEDRERALQQLVYGQLLISRKRLAARQHLARGFSLAARYLDTPDYFLMVRRHELLACLPVSGMPAMPQDLHALLTEAAVIRRLQKGEHRAHMHMHHDTLG